jgi:hypothetical protein
VLLTCIGRTRGGERRQRQAVAVLGEARFERRRQRQRRAEEVRHGVQEGGRLARDAVDERQVRRVELCGAEDPAPHHLFAVLVGWKAWAANAKVANRDDFGDTSRGRFAKPADFPRHDGSPYSHLRARRERLGFPPRSRALFCRPVPCPTRYDSHFASLYVESVGRRVGGSIRATQRRVSNGARAGRR